MPIVLGVDLGTTTLTALALDTTRGEILACATAPNTAQTPAPAGRSEWDPARIAERTFSCLAQVAGSLGERLRDLAGLGITGQQHGVVLVDGALRPLTPLINWQDRRGEEAYPGTAHTYVQESAARAGADSPARTGCRLATGYMAVTLFWLRANGLLPARATACFLMDYFGALLTGRPPVTDPTCAASSGALDLRRGDWDEPLLGALGLSRELFPPVRPSGERLGGLTADASARTGLPAGLPVFAGVGDNQASFLGSVARRGESVLVNVGTGGQVAAFTDPFAYDPLLETRPFPRGGYLLVAAGLSGGAAYSALERFFRAVGKDVLGTSADEALYPAMNELAARIPGGADGLRCEPFFFGTRAQPDLRASWAGLSAANFTPAHLTRALLEGMARTFRTGHEQITRALGRPFPRLVGAGNGVRANPLLARIIAEEFGLEMAVPAHREEAAFGAALLAAVAGGALPDLDSAGRLIRYEGSPAG